MVDEAVEALNPVRNIGKVQMFVAGTDFKAYAEQLGFFYMAKRFITINLNSYSLSYALCEGMTKTFSCRKNKISRFIVKF